MNTKSKIVVAVSLIGMVCVGWSIPSWADDRHYQDYYHYNNYYRYYPHYHNSSHSSDDAAWAIGGLVVGAIVGAAANQQQVNKEQRSTTAQVVRLCTETVKTDSRGNTMTERTCRDELVQ